MKEVLSTQQKANKRVPAANARKFTLRTPFLAFLE